MKLSSFLKRLLVPIMGGGWHESARQFCADAEYWRERAKHAEALLTGQSSVICGHVLVVARESSVEKSLRYHFGSRHSTELKCVMAPHTGGYHGALGFRWDDTGELHEQSD
jgi:hypothetical protein